MSPDLGRFLQPDPIGFKGDSSNLYRYCGNDWANKTDPLGLNPGDPFPSALAAGVDAVRFINPTSIQQNKEYGGVIYKLKGSYYVTKTVTTNEGNKVQVGGEKLPANAQRVGDYHTHGDYSVRDARTGQPVRTGDPRKDSYNSDHLGPTDLTTSHARGQGKSEYTTVVGTPSGKIRSLDGTDPSSKEQEVKAAPGKSSGGSSGGFGWISASSSGGSASGTAGQSIGSYGEQPDGSFVDSQGSNINLAGDGGWSPGTLRLTPAP